MEESWSRIIGEEPDSDFITRVANTHDVSDDRIVEVVEQVTSAADHVEVVPVQMSRVLSMKATTLNDDI
jgi:hypothetical protein